jgi:hypothetical protein
MKKPITELSEAELLELIRDEPNKIKIYEWPNDVMDFISVYNIKTGTNPITLNLLYRLYRKWSNSPVKMRELSITLTDIFPSKRSTIIYIDKTLLNLKEEIYKLLKPVDKTRHKGWLEHFNKYLNEYSIKSGGLFIKDTVLYNLYDKWCYKKRNPLGLTQFTNHCKLYFNWKLVYNHWWFKVDESIKNHLSENLIKEMSTRRAPKKVKKIKIPISSPRSKTQSKDKV